MEEAASSLGLSPDLSQLRKSIKHVNVASNALDQIKADAERTFEEVLRKQPCYNSSGIACWLEKLRDIALGSPLRRQLFWATWHVRRANEKLIGFERGFISEDGLEGREWYRHLGVAPGKWLGASSMCSCTSVLGTCADEPVWDRIWRDDVASGRRGTDDREERDVGGERSEASGAAAEQAGNNVDGVAVFGQAGGSWELRCPAHVASWGVCLHRRSLGINSPTSR